eukprot:5622196-Pleurochrysis_carterae.AAC.2
MEGCERYLRDPIGCIRSAAMFYVVLVAMDVKTIVYVGFRTISVGCNGMIPNISRPQGPTGSAPGHSLAATS